MCDHESWEIGKDYDKTHQEEGVQLTATNSETSFQNMAMIGSQLYHPCVSFS